MLSIVNKFLILFVILIHYNVKEKYIVLKFQCCALLLFFVLHLPSRRRMLRT
jgi:hypothetical protein